MATEEAATAEAQAAAMEAVVRVAATEVGATAAVERVAVTEVGAMEEGATGVSSDCCLPGSIPHSCSSHMCSRCRYRRNCPHGID